MWLIRHGETAAEARGRCYGSLDVPLSPQGAVSIQSVSERLPRFAALYSSPRLRCQQTASIVAQRHNIPVLNIQELAELDFGDFEGKTYDEISTSHPELYALWMERPTEVTFPNGESFAQMQTRVLAAARNLIAQQQGQVFGIVSHGGVNRILLADALGIRCENVFRIAQRYGAVNCIRFLGSYPSVELVNGF
jgi:alpha-ribazole phosphatase